MHLRTNQRTEFVNNACYKVGRSLFLTDLSKCVFSCQTKRCKKNGYIAWVERWVFKYLESFTSRHPKILYFVSFLSFSWLATPWFGVGGLWPPKPFTNLGSICVTSVLGSSNFRTGRGKDDDNSPSETQLTKVITYC